jgi:hypothetical protein
VNKVVKPGEFIGWNDSHADARCLGGENTAGRYAVQAVVEDFDAIKDQLGGSVRVDKWLNIVDWMQAGSLDQPEERQRVFSWLAERVNTL